MIDMWIVIVKKEGNQPDYEVKIKAEAYLLGEDGHLYFFNIADQMVKDTVACFVPGSWIGFYRVTEAI